MHHPRLGLAADGLDEVVDEHGDNLDRIYIYMYSYIYIFIYIYIQEAERERGKREGERFLSLYAGVYFHLRVCGGDGLHRDSAGTREQQKILDIA
jgi:hypothetical protein